MHILYKQTPLTHLQVKAFVDGILFEVGIVFYKLLITLLMIKCEVSELVVSRSENSI